MYTVNRLNPVYGKTQYRLGSRQDYILYGTTSHLDGVRKVTFASATII